MDGHPEHVRLRRHHLSRCQMDVADNLRSRRIRTQIPVLRRVKVVATLVVSLAAILLSFPQVRVGWVSIQVHRPSAHPHLRVRTIEQLA